MKRIRTVVIAAIVILTLAITLSRIEIEPPEPVRPAPTATVTDITLAPTPTQQPDAPTETLPAEAPGPTETTQPVETEAPVELPPEETLAPVPVPPVEQAKYCTVEIRCDTVTDTSKLENEAVIPYIPADGTMLAATKVEFCDGETVFDVLKRATRDNGIHLEFRQDNVYTGGISVEGLGYLYDMDAGPLSGWMYKVNEQFPNKGCAGFYVSEGDAIVWVYTCDLGMDVGDNSIW